MLEPKELITLGRDDPLLWCRVVFPGTTRQAFAPFHREIWRLLRSPARLVSLQVFRGSGKTSILRMFTLWRLAYDLSRTVLYVSRSQAHAEKSIEWIRRQLDKEGSPLRTVYGLEPGVKWTSTEINVVNRVLGTSHWVTAAGITGNIRGLNQEDWRPDLIVLDDPLDEENTATAEQRHKVHSLIHGALAASLAPRSEVPDAKLVMLQTPLHPEDASMMALKDPSWTTAVFPCMDDEGNSAWPARFPSEELRSERENATAANRLSIWMREMECRLISPETNAFKVDWLRVVDELPAGERPVHVVIGLDPVPPPSERAIAKGIKGDYEVFAVWARLTNGQMALMDLAMNRGHQPSWTVSEFFRLGLTWRPLVFVVESVAYQRTLAAFLRAAMIERGVFFALKEKNDRRRKVDRIPQILGGPAQHGQLLVPKRFGAFIEQFMEFPGGPHDDVLDASAMAIEELQSLALYAPFNEVMEEREGEGEFPLAFCP